MNFDPITAIVFGVIALGLLLLAAKMSFQADKTRYGDTARTIVNVLGIIFIVTVAVGFAGVLFFGDQALDLLRQVLGA